ncbi:MAG: hypothetical protein ACKVVT_17220 [Dehalococcoidia bacterium]
MFGFDPRQGWIHDPDQLRVDGDQRRRRIGGGFTRLDSRLAILGAAIVTFIVVLNVAVRGF